MSYYALFQLGTGSGLLSTSQTEETFAARTKTWCVGPLSVAAVKAAFSDQPYWRMPTIFAPHGKAGAITRKR